MEEYRPWGMEEKAFIMLMHLSQLSGIVIPGAGLALPVVMWATNKDKSKEIDRHGKVILNWIISMLIYMTISSILIVVLIGFVGIIALVIINIIFIIMGAMKANEGEFWPYPLCIKFFAVE